MPKAKAIANNGGIELIREVDGAYGIQGASTKYVELIAIGDKVRIVPTKVVLDADEAYKASQEMLSLSVAASQFQSVMDRMER